MAQVMTDSSRHCKRYPIKGCLRSSRPVMKRFPSDHYEKEPGPAKITGDSRFIISHRRTRFRQLPSFSKLWENLQEKVGMAEPRKKTQFKGVDLVVPIETRDEYENIESMWVTKKERICAVREAFEEVYWAGGVESWKSFDWIE